jgi:hypothetical protein
MRDFVLYGTYSVNYPYSRFNGGKKRPEMDGEVLRYQVASYIQKYEEATDIRGKVKKRFATEMYDWLAWWSGRQHISRYIHMQLEDYTPLERRIMIDILRELGYTKDHLGF